MRKFEKLFALKQIIKAYAELSKYSRLTNKKNPDPSYITKHKEALAAFKLVKDEGIYNGGRVLHVAYSLLKGKTYPQIENSVREGSQLSDWEWKAIVKIMEKYKDEESKVEIPGYPFPSTNIHWQDKSLNQ